MNDFYNFDEYSMPMEIKVLLWFLYIVIFAYAATKMFVLAPKNKRYVKASNFITLYFALYAVFYCINADYFRYREWLNVPFFTDWQKEQVYVYIILFCKSLPIEYPFELFRLIVWGGGLLLVSYTAKMYRSLLMPGLIILILFVFYSGVYCYARVSLAMAVYFMGVSIFLWGEKRTAKLLGLVVAVCSYFFHHELIVGIGMLPCLLIPFEKRKTIILTLIMLAMMMVVINYINSNLALMESVFGNDELSQKIEKFNDEEQRVFRMSTFVSYINFFFPFLLITNFFYRHKRIPKVIAGIYRVTLGLLMASLAFFVVSGPRSVYTYRVLYISIIPMSILIAYCYNHHCFKKYQFAIMLLLALLSCSARFINHL